MCLYSYLNNVQKPIYFSLAHTVRHACNNIRDDLVRAWQAVLPETLRVLKHNTEAAQAAFRPADKVVELRVEEVNGHEIMRMGSNGPFRVYRNCLGLTSRQVAALLAVPLMSLLYDFRPADKAVELRVEEVNGHEIMWTGSNGPFRVYRNCLGLTSQQVAALLAVPLMSLLYNVRYNH